MYTTEELRLIDDYFTLLFFNAFCVTIRSKCTGHEWHIIVREGAHFRSFEILHRHNNHDEYHIHGHAGSFKKVLQAIKSPDAFQLNGRKKDFCKSILNYNFTPDPLLSLTEQLLQAVLRSP